MTSGLRALVAAAAFGCLIAGASGKTASHQGFSLTPMTLKQPRGILQLTNGNSRAMQFRVQAFPPRHIDGSMTAALEPYPQEEQDTLVRIRPQAARLAARSTRNFNYKVLAPARLFYLCATTPDGTLLLRICSRWQGSL